MPFGNPQSDVAAPPLVERPVGGEHGVDTAVGQRLAKRPRRLQIGEIANHVPVVVARVADLQLIEAVGTQLAPGDVPQPAQSVSDAHPGEDASGPRDGLPAGAARRRCDRDIAMFGFCKKRKVRESALPPSEPVESPERALGSFAGSEGTLVVGRQVGGGGVDPSSVESGLGAADGLAALAQLGPMIQKAITEGNVQIVHGPAQTVDLRGTGIREQILGIMQEHGIDAEAGTAATSVDTADYGEMQRQILDALSSHGVDLGATGEGGGDQQTGQTEIDTRPRDAGD